MAFAWDKSTPATGAVAIYNLKTLLKAQGWTVQASGDASSYNASGDLITTGAAGAGGLGNTKAWFRIQDPAGVREYTCQRGANNYQYRIKYSFAGKFTGGTPGLDQTPTATDEVVIVGGGSDASPTYATVLHSGDGTYRWQCGADGASPYGFFGVGYPTGGGTDNGHWIYDPLDDTDPADADPYVHYITSYAMIDSTISGSSNPPEGFVAAAAPTTWVDFGAAMYTTDAQATIPTNLPTNPITGEDTLFPILYMRRSAVANPGYKGKSTLMRWSCPARVTGDTLATKTWIVINDICLPWDGSVPSV